ncbi:electron transport complex subunit RsxE [Chloroflexota bacterium]
MPAFIKEFSKGLITTNPIFVLALGLCPALAVSDRLEKALWMSLGVLFVLFCSNILISAIRKSIPNVIRIPTYIVIIATFVTMVSLVFEAYIPAIYNALGIYLSLIVVNCIILGRAEAFASKNPVKASIADALGISAGFSLALIIVSLIREILGTGGLAFGDTTFFTLPVLGEHPLSLLALSPGAFLVIGLLMALFRRLGVIKSE